MPTADVEELLKKIERNPVDTRAHFNLGRNRSQPSAQICVKRSTPRRAHFRREATLEPGTRVNRPQSSGEADSNQPFAIFVACKRRND